MIGAWPGLCVAVAAHGLPGTRAERPPEPIGGVAWRNLNSCVVHERIPGLLMLAIADGALVVTPEQADEAGRAHRASMTTAVLLERTLVETASLLERAGVEFRVLKGTAVARLDYEDPALRSFGDVDLLVPSAQFDSAVAALEEAGHRRRYPEPRRGFDAHFGKGSCLVRPDGYEVDLHRTFAMGPFGLALPVDDLWRSSSAFHVGGRVFAALGPEERFMHACFHAVLGSPVPRLSALRDVAQMHLCRPLDGDRVLELAASWRAQAVVARAVDVTCQVLQLDVTTSLTSWAATYRPRRRDRRALRVYTDAGASYAAKSFGAVRAAPGLLGKARMLFGLAFPRRQYIDDRREGRLHRWRRGVRQVLRSRRRPG